MWWGWRVFHTHYTEKVCPQNGFSGAEYGVLCRWGLVMFCAFGFPSHVNYVVLSYWWTFTAECFPTFFAITKILSGTKGLHLNRASSDQGFFCIQGPSLAWIICVSKEKRCSGWWLFNIHWIQLLSSMNSVVSKSLGRPSICCHISSTLEFLPWADWASHFRTFFW